MRSKLPDTPANDPDRIADNSRHERERSSSGEKIVAVPALDVTTIPDSMAVWMERYQTFAVAGVRSVAVAAKIDLHLVRFRDFFQDAYGHDRLSICLQRDVAAWQRALSKQGLAPATVNNHLASLSAFTWGSGSFGIKTLDKDLRHGPPNPLPIGRCLKLGLTGPRVDDHRL